MGRINGRRARGIVLILCLIGVSLLTATTALAQDSTAVDSALIKEIELELGAPAAAPPTSAAPAVQQSRGGKTTNPDISVIGDFRTWYLSDAERNLDFGVHEVETSLRAAVDPYARGDVYISIGNEDGDYVFELEEAYLTTLTLPFQLQAKLGRFRSDFGKVNPIHPHALPFPDMPTMNEYYFGDEGLKDEGASIDWLLPNRKFYQELTFEFTGGPSGNPSFERSEKDRFLYLGRLKNFWDLTENATLELGLSGSAGPNDLGATTTLAGADLTYIWKPLRMNTYRMIKIQVEGLMSNRRSSVDETINSWGMYALIQYQLARRWHVTARYDYSDKPDDADWNETGIGAFLGWYATEFQKLEFGAKTRSGPHFDRNWEVLARLIFVLGTHGAHQY